MIDSDLDKLYRKNLGVSHTVALRGVFDAGYVAAFADMRVKSGIVDKSASVVGAAALANTPVLPIPSAAPTQPVAVVPVHVPVPTAAVKV